MYFQKFKVKGIGIFPIDMLRYDECFPLYEVDSAKIVHGERLVEIELGRYVVENRELTHGRWRSFSWKVVEGSVETTEVR